MNKSLGHILNNGFKKFLKRSRAFTIVELLVVIVVIGILAAITIVSYSGITNKAITASIKNDLDNNLKLLKMYHIDHGYYPSSLDANNCPNAPDVDSRYCLKAMSGAILMYAGGGQSFELTDTHSATNISYKIIEDGTMTLYAPGPWKQVSVASGHSCAIALNNRAYCWGGNTFGQIGDSTTTNRDNPVAVSQGERPSLEVKSIKTGGSFTCAISTDDRVYCWGYNNFGNLGDGTTANRNIPTAVLQGDRSSLTVKQIALSAESHNACAIASNDRAYCWGMNDYGQIGDGTTNVRYTPTAMLQGDRMSLSVSRITVGSIHACLLDLNSEAYCWGYNGQGGVGNNSTVDVYQPTAVLQGARPSLSVKSISAGKHNSCVVASNNQAYCWGYNGFGSLGDGTAVSRYVPVSIVQGAMPSLNIKDITPSGAYHACAINFNDQVYCWGRNDYSQLGHGGVESFVYSPVAVLQGARSSLPVKALSVGTNAACATDQVDKIYCWGSPSPLPIEVVVP